MTLQSIIKQHTIVDENDNNIDDDDDQLEKFTVIKSPNKKMNV